MSAARLAEEMTRVGIKWDRSIVANLENGRRSIITVEELLGLAFVLDVAPIHLMVPQDSAGWYAVTPEGYATLNDRVRAWIRGAYALPGHTDERKYFSEVPEDEWMPPRRLSLEEQEQLFEQLTAAGLMQWHRVSRSTGEVAEYDPASRQWIKLDTDQTSSQDDGEGHER